MAHDVFIRLDGIDGESMDDRHFGWIRVLTFSHQIELPLAGSAPARVEGGAGRTDLTAGRASHGDMVFLKDLDRATPKLAFHCCSGKLIKQVVLEICDSANNREKIMEFIMSDVLVRSVSPGLDTIMATDREAFTREKIGLRYGRIEWIYTMLDPATAVPKGNVHYYWDVAQNRGG